jgi:hypothetical protein
VIDVLVVVSAYVAVALVVMAFAGLVHMSWLAKERLLAWLAARMGVAYEVRQPWWMRWVKR